MDSSGSCQNHTYPQIHVNISHVVTVIIFSRHAYYPRRNEMSSVIFKVNVVLLRPSHPAAGSSILTLFTNSSSFDLKYRPSGIL